ncbi:MAG TPA: SHOCT domain-containing protein [Nitrospinaceae bacterium]|jgi:hypothetical protein|nr:SHOCT domain-containing protein [Nitrospinaceae bacterium]HIL25863.1 SHOCT domain-containing protein [Nitrospinaceae bacterium]
MTHIKKINFFSYIRIIFILLYSCLFVGCATPEKRLTKDQLTISYQPKSSLESEIKKLRLQHPVKISAAQMANHLFSLQYKELTLTGKKKYIFSPSDILEISPIMTKALNRIKPSKVLHYEVETPRGKTAGIIFQANKKINWRFKSINGSNFLNTSFHNGGSTWELLPKNGQRFHKESSTLGNERKRNWIISDLELQVQSKRGLKSGSLKQKSSTPKSPKQKSSASRPSSEKGEFEKRLQFLKELRQKQLIDDEEYKHKKTELLEQFP